MRKYVEMVLIDSGDKPKEWTEWCKEHVADIIGTPGFLSAQAFRRRPEFSYAHPEVLPTLPPYDLMTFYVIDEDGKNFLTTNERPAGSSPGGGSRPFPSALGGYTGNQYLWEAISPEFRAFSERPEEKKRFVTVLTNTAENREDWPQWGIDHVADMISEPIFCGTQAFKVRPDFSYGHKEVLETQPPYDLLTFYEINDEGFEFLTTKTRPIGAPPEAGTRAFPSPLGQHVGDTYMWEAISPEYQVAFD